MRSLDSLNVFELVISILGTSILTAGLLFLSLRWIFGKLVSGLSGLTKLGAKVAGEESGFSRRTSAVTEEIAADILSGPKLGGLKFIANQIGLDIDSYIEEHGAVETLAGFKAVGDLVGINIEDVMKNGLSGVGNVLNMGKGSIKTGKAGNPYKV